MGHTKNNPNTRNGLPLTILPKGDRRRMSDGKNAWRKMSPEQRRDFRAWQDSEGLKVAGEEN
jgi:hypothetical protein